MEQINNIQEQEPAKKPKKKRKWTNVIGGKQLLQKAYVRVGLKEGKWHNTIGNLPFGAMILFYGKNGSGKTEACMQLVTELTQYGLTTEWVSYEQRHGPDVQDAYRRNVCNIPEKGGKVLFNDPFGKGCSGTVEELDERMSRKGSAKVWVIDSIDRCRFREHDFERLCDKHLDHKIIICLAFEGNDKEPKKALAQSIGGYGHYKLRVNKFILTVEKSRFGGHEDYIVNEELARKKNPLYPLWAPVQEPVKKQSKQRKPRKPKTDD